MKLPRSFSLLTFLLLATIAAIAAALYEANNELSEKRALFKKYSDEMGFIDVEDESLLHIRSLGGFPQMSFGFRYQLPDDQDYTLHVGEGIIDPETGFPPLVMKREIRGDESQGTLSVSLNKMPTNLGVRWTVACIDRQSLGRHTERDDRRFTWLQTYLAAFPTEKEKGNPGLFFSSNQSFVSGHGPVQTFEADEVPVLFERSEFHPSAVASLTPELLKNRRTFMIWLEPVKKLDPVKR